MGCPMAINLVKAGYQVIGHNRSRDPVKRLEAAGGRSAASVAEVAGAASVIITMLTDDAAVDSVYFTEGLLESAGAGTLLIDMSTVSPDTSLRVAEAAASHRVQVLDAPVSGGEQGAIEATLSIMVGGDEAVFEQARPVLEALGKTIVRVGGTGAGQTVKAANQLLVGGIIGLVSEAIIFLERRQVDLKPAIEVLAGGLAGNRILDRKAEAMVARRFTPGFRIDLHHKDMGILMSAARESGVPLLLGATVAQLFAAARARGDGDLDHGALLNIVEALAGCD